MQEQIQKQHLVEHHQNHQQDQWQQLWDLFQWYYVLETFRKLEEQIGNFFGEFENELNSTYRNRGPS